MLLRKSPEVESRLGFGTGELKGEIARAAVEAALTVGYTTIDTAARYDNEREVGQAIAGHDLVRHAFSVVTKGPHDPHEHGYDSTLRMFDRSFGRLGLNYIDWYLVHWPAPDKEDRMETWRAMERIAEEKAAIGVGVSNYAQHHLEELRDSEHPPRLNQIEFHPFIYRQQEPLLEYCKENNIAVMGYSTYAGGQGVGNEVIDEIAVRHETSSRKVLARWALQHGVTPLTRSSDPYRVDENIQFHHVQLSDREMDVLDNLEGVRLFPDPNTI